MVRQGKENMGESDVQSASRQAAGEGRIQWVLRPASLILGQFLNPPHNNGEKTRMFGTCMLGVEMRQVFAQIWQEGLRQEQAKQPPWNPIETASAIRERAVCARAMDARVKLVHRRQKLFFSGSDNAVSTLSGQQTQTKEY